ncbi:hypothetical protein ACVWYU_001818 [Pseudomonas sp. TE12234]
MRKAITALALIMLAGCSIQGRESDGPDLQVTSSKTPQAYARCLAPKWLAMNPATSSVETEQGYKIAASGTFYGVISLANIERVTGGSTIKAYFPATKLGTDGWKQPVIDCL